MSSSTVSQIRGVVHKKSEKSFRGGERLRAPAPMPTAQTRPLVISTNQGFVISANLVWTIFVRFKPLKAQKPAFAGR